MSGPTYGANGLVIQTPTEVLADVNAQLVTAFGPSIQAENGQTVIGQLASAIAQLLYDNQTGLDAAYQSMFLDGAAGVNLDRLVQLLGLTRNAATATVVYGAALHNSDLAVAVTVPQGAVVQHQATGQLFATTTAVTVAALATEPVNLRALETGPIQIAAASTWTWVTSFAGSTTILVSNLLVAGTPGTDEETDAELRVRALASAHLPAKGTVLSIQAAIADLNGVTYCRVFENTALSMGITSPISIPLLPGKSFVAVVAGGVAADIGAIIFAQKPAGIGTYGNHTETIVDSFGYSHDIKFEQASATAIYVSVTVSGVTTAFDSAIKAAVLAYINGLTVGDTIVADALRCAIFDSTVVNGKSTCTGISGLKFDTTNPPGNTANLAIAWNRYPNVTLAHVTVSH